MDGCFVAYHNTQRVFGFEYVPITKMDDALFGSHEEGDKVFKICLGYMERILEDATKAYPERVRPAVSSICLKNLTVLNWDQSVDVDVADHFLCEGSEQTMGLCSTCGRSRHTRASV